MDSRDWSQTNLLLKQKGFCNCSAAKALVEYYKKLLMFFPLQDRFGCLPKAPLSLHMLHGIQTPVERAYFENGQASNPCQLLLGFATIPPSIILSEPNAFVPLSRK